MNALASSLTPGWELAGWTMVHFLWVGAAVAAMGAALRLTLAWAAPSWRYAASLAALAAVAATPVCIAMRLAPHYAAPATRAVAMLDRTALPPTALAQTAPLPPQYIELKPSAAAATTPSTLAATPAPAKSAMVAPATSDWIAPATSDWVAPATADWVASQASPSPAPGMPVTTPAEALWGAVPRGVRAWARVAARWLPVVWLVGAPLTFLWTCVGLAGGGFF